MKGYLAVKDIGRFSGRYIGWAGPCAGDIAYFRSHDFCWDILTDPAFQKKIVIADQIISENRPPMDEEIQSFMPHLSGVVFLRDPQSNSEDSNYGSLTAYLNDHNIPSFLPDRPALIKDILSLSKPSTAGIDTNGDNALSLTNNRITYNIDDLKSVSAPHEFYWDLTAGDYPPEEKTVVVWDFGANYNLLRSLKLLGCRVRVAPPTTRAGSRPLTAAPVPSPANLRHGPHIHDPIRSATTRCPAPRTSRRSFPSAAPWTARPISES